MQHGQLVADIRQKLIATFTPLLAGGGGFALIDYPDASNSGDHAIWLGEKVLLHQLGIQPVYQCSMQSYDRAAMAEALGSGTILMHGGGNFGDIYHYHDFRLQVLRDFPDNPVIVLPQTVMFFSSENLSRSVQQFAAHGKATICARDALSFHTLTKFFGAATRIVMVPDMAFMLGTQPRSGSANFDIMWLGRTDKEAVYRTGIAQAAGLGDLTNTVADLGNFADGCKASAAVAVSGNRLLISDWYHITVSEKESVARYIAMNADQRSKFWVERAMRLLSAGRVVITDRLHGHILCTLMGIPHVLLNNNYGKNFSYFETWSRPLGLCRLAGSPADAWKQAQNLLAYLQVEQMSGPRPSDTVHWGNPDNLHATWSYRSERAASYVKAGATILDVGCGKMMIEKMLPAGCRYIPSDLVARDERTIVCDFNKGEYPPYDGASHISVLGVMEYLNDTDAFWRWLSISRARIIFSYVPLNPAFPSDRRRAMGWINDFSGSDIIQLANRAGYALTAQENIPPDTLLFVFDPRPNAT